MATPTPMDDKQRTRMSKYLSKHLRHEPERLGLALGPGGWVLVADLLQACERDGFPMTRGQLEEVVATSPKQRFSFDEGGERIRANQGHSVEVDLQLDPVAPPEVLFHGTGERSVEQILREGLQRRARHHVHLSLEAETARSVGARHGKPVILEVAAKEMAAAGYLFYCSANGVWLVDEVPARFLRVFCW